MLMASVHAKQLIGRKCANAAVQSDIKLQTFEKCAEKIDRARIINKTRAHKLLTNSSGAVTGLVYKRGGTEFTENGPVILCSGGFGADFTQNSLLAQYRPDLMHLPTTNGEYCTGGGIKMGEAIGGKSIDLEWVQAHLTGLVKPDDPDVREVRRDLLLWRFRCGLHAEFLARAVPP